MATKICLIIDGGVLQDVVGIQDEHAEVTLIDYDNVREGNFEPGSQIPHFGNCPMRLMKPEDYQEFVSYHVINYLRVGVDAKKS